MGPAKIPYVVQGSLDGHTLSATEATAKEAFAKAIEWHLIHKFVGVTITNGARVYSIAEYSLAMALGEIAGTLAAELRHKARPRNQVRRSQRSNKPYSISYFARKHSISEEQARELIRKIGRDRDKLNEAAAKMLPPASF